MPEEVLLGGVDGVVPLGVVDPGILLEGMLLGGRVLGVAVPVGEQGIVTVVDVLTPPAVPLDAVEPMPVDEVVPAPVLLGLEVALPVLAPVAVPLAPVVVQGATVPVVAPLGVVPPTPVVVDWLGVVVVD